MADKLKFALAVFLLAAGVVGYYLLSGDAMIFRVLSVLIGIGAGATVGRTTAPGLRFAEFARESAVEAKKVVWPTRKETVQTTAAVFAFVLVMAVVLWVTDKSVEWVLYDLILGWKR